jgi:hypothetical protein
LINKLAAFFLHSRFFAYLLIDSLLVEKTLFVEKNLIFFTAPCLGTTLIMNIV